ncbi:MAG: ferrous iron transport protein B [Anaerolineae bacterium]|nr:ferrous iron transport protein B [Anaerolineae bacterium]
MPLTIALAGNPNVGKSTIFNALTGARQHTGNWPGKTVEKKEGLARIGEQDVLIVDLPGTYSLTAYSIEEIITRDFIVRDRPSAVVAVIDASNIERNLYLVAQIIELEIPLILALNMTDLAASRGIAIDVTRLSEQLGGIPVIETSGGRVEGVEALRTAIAGLAEGRHPSLHIPYSPEIERELAVLSEATAQRLPAEVAPQPRWLATKLLEDDPAVLDALSEADRRALLDAARAVRKRIEAETGEDTETLIADQRYQFIGMVTAQAVHRPSQVVVTLSDRIDQVVTHRLWGVPIFLLVMWIVFQFTANVSAPLLAWVDAFMNQTLYGWAGRLMGAVGLGGTWPEALLRDGVIAGVGGVLVFVPVLFFLFTALALLEDSGYMARAAFVMDRVMRWMGLQGKSFLPMIVGFGCTVPAVYATRTLSSPRERRLTAFLATFMSCGARLPVYVVFGAAFFGAQSGHLIFAMYVLGIVVALATGLVLKHTVYRGQPPAPFVMELPPYRMPRLQNVLRQTWEHTEGFLVKAGTVIFGVSAVLWLLMATPIRPGAGAFNDVPPHDSIFGAVSDAIAPVFAPAGFGTWQASGSLVTGFIAKEVIVGTISQIYAVEALDEPAAPDVTVPQEAGEAALGLLQALALTIQEAINIVPRTANLIPGLSAPELQFFAEATAQEDASRVQAALLGSFSESAGSPEAGRVAAVAFNVFVLLYVPCMAAVSTMRQEFGWRWMWAQVAYTLGLAWVAAVTVFQAGRLVFL